MYADCNTPLPINPDSKNNGQIFINQLIFLFNFNFTVHRDYIFAVPNKIIIIELMKS